ncbi:hypothetical protein SDC9_138503 [bioreactor metagenome]|uniref:Uncharacterized protein n=1 Tax=bioreactor metagenome TaxID=1076179 RepID=A0A645DQ42_9ZZZZ
MSHDKDLGGISDQLAQRVGHHPALDLGALFGFLGAPAVKLKIEPPLDHRLVSPSGKGHLDGQRRILKQLAQGGGILADADGERGRDATGVMHLPHGVQDRKFGVLKRLQVPLLEQEEIAVPVVPAEHPLGLVRPVHQTLVDFTEHGRAGILIDVLHEVLIVVHQEDGQHRSAGIVGLPKVGVLRNVHPIGGGQKTACAVLAARAHHMAEYHAPPLSHGNLGRAAAFPLQQPSGVKIRHRQIQLGVKQMLPPTDEAQKAFVAPDDLPGFGAKDNHGQGRVYRCVPNGSVHMEGHVLQMRQQLPAAAAAHSTHVEIKSHGAQQLNKAQPRAQETGGNGKYHQRQHKGAKVRLGEPGRFSFHFSTSLPWS